MIDALRESFESVQATIADGPIFPSVSADEIGTYLQSRYNFHQEMPLEDVIEDVEHMLQVWQVQVTHPRYFGLFNPSVTLASVVADTLVSMYNSQLANWRTSPIANEIERHTLQWLANKFGFPPDSCSTFTSGGTEANLSAMVVALTRAFPGYGEHGLRSLDKQPTIYLTAEAHNGYNKLAHMTGIGRRALRIVATDHALKMDMLDLKRQVKADLGQGFAPFMVIGTCGTTAAGVIDPLQDIADFCRQDGLWFHADAAWGGAAILSPTLRDSLAGIEAADSITCDAHKWFSVPMGAGMFFCRHSGSVAEAFRVDVSYMPKKNDSVADPYTNTTQWSRRFIGLKLFVALAQGGEAGMVEMIEHQTRMGDVLRQELLSTGWSIANQTSLPVVCFRREGLVPTDLLAALREHQTAWMTECQIEGVPVMRACITSFKTTSADIRCVVDEMNKLFHQIVGRSILDQDTVATARTAS